MFRIPPAGWHRLEQALDEALELPTQARPDYLNIACAGDPELRARVEALLEADSAAGAFLEGSAGEYAGPIVSAALDAADVPSSPLPDEQVGALVGPYRVLRELARGGMGAVYLAERADGQFEQRVALKLIKRGLDSEEIHRRFLAERQILARLNHPHVARLLDGGVSIDGRPYFAMEYVDGVPITTHCDAHRYGIEERLRLFQDVGDGVRYAHQNLVVHRDLKPSNILVTAAGEVKLLDFGIAKLLHEEPGEVTVTQMGLRVMTPEYAAPEQVRGEPVGTPTDVYALGAVLYELLAGRRVHRLARHTPAEIERVVCELEPEAPSSVVTRPAEIGLADGSRGVVPAEGVARARGTEPERLRRRLRGDLDTIVLKALQKDPGRRYPTADALLEDLRRHTAGLPLRARPDSAAYRAGKFFRRHRLAVAAGALLILSLVGGLAGTAWQARATARQAAVARREAAKATEVKDFLVGLFQMNEPEQSRGREITAREMLERGRRELDSALAGHPEVHLELLQVVGEVYGDLGLYPPADTLLRQAVELAGRLYGTQSPEAAEVLTILGGLLWAQGAYQQADSVLTAALTIRRRTLGRDDPKLAATLNNLAVVVGSNGDRERAEPLLREALAIDGRHYGNDHLEVATDLNNLGLNLWTAGNLSGADSALRAALAIRRKRLDRDHPIVLTSMHVLAVVLDAQGDYETAERLERDVLDKRRRLYPGGHPDLAYSLYQLGVTLDNRGRYAAAESLLVETLEMRRKWLGADHDLTIGTLHSLGALRSRMGRTGAGEAAVREALRLWRETLGTEHPDVAEGLGSLGAILTDAGKFAEADTLLRQALALQRTGDSPMAVARTLGQLGVLRQRTGRHAEAVNAFREALATSRTVFPADHPRIAEALTGLGVELTDRGSAGEAEPLLRQALAIRSEKLGPADRRTAETRRALGVCLAALGRVREGEALLLESYRLLSRDRYSARERAETLRRLAAFYQLQGDRGKAAEHR